MGEEDPPPQPGSAKVRARISAVDPTRRDLREPHASTPANSNPPMAKPNGNRCGGVFERATIADADFPGPRIMAAPPQVAVLVSTVKVAVTGVVGLETVAFDN